MPVTVSRNSSVQLLFIIYATLLSDGLAVGNDTRDWSMLPNFDEIRIERGGRDDFIELCGVGGRVDSDDPTMTYFANEDWEAMAASAAARLESCPVDIQFHLAMAFAMQKLGRDSEAKVHEAWYEGLIDSILASGDGRSSDSAFVTISIAEEYEVLSAFGFAPKSQSLTEDQRDRFVVTDKEGNEHVIYFFPKFHWYRLAKIFGN